MNKELPINEQIKVEELMVIGPNGEQMGLKKLEDALTLSRYAGQIGRASCRERV